MIQMMKKIEVKFTGDDEYRPKELPRDKWLSVLGYEWKRRNTEYEGKPKVVNDLFFIVVGNNGKVCRVSEISCSVRIDQRSEIEGGQLIQMMNNITTLLKVISEKVPGSNSR